MLINNKVVNIASYCVIGVATLFVALVLVMILYPIDPGTTINSITLPPEVNAGDTVAAKVDYCKNEPGKAISNYTLVTSNQVFYLPPIETNRPTGCNVVTIDVTIPEDAPSGKAHYELDVRREYNVLHSDVVYASSNEFKINGSNT